MAEGPYEIVAKIGESRIFVGDSVTYFVDLRAHDVIVCGSHGGDTAALFGAASGAKALILNDAGIGKERAGIKGLETVAPYGIAAATVDFRSSRIGSGVDTWTAGVISHCNGLAQAAGVSVGMAAADAARAMASWKAGEERERPETPADRPPLAIATSLPRAVAMDSASMVNQDCVGVIVVTGSHGGTTGGRAVRAAVAAAFFNDAGVGKDQAGISRLPMLDTEGIPAGAVDCNSARIGDGWDTYESGVLSHVNDDAAKHGLRAGMAMRDAIAQLRQRQGANHA